MRHLSPHDWTPMRAARAIEVIVAKIDAMTPPELPPAMRDELIAGSTAFAQMAVAALVEAGVLEADEGLG